MAIKEFDIRANYSGEISLAIGYFDAVHLGHIKLIEECNNSGYESAVFTFKNNPYSHFGRGEGQLYTYAERAFLFSKMNVHICISAYADINFLNMRASAFLDMLICGFNIKHVVIGTDYTCGFNREFDAKDVKKYLNLKGIAVTVVDMFLKDGEKISSSEIRRLLSLGEIEKVNALLPTPYFILGTVVSGKGVGGKELGFPTANLNIEKDKLSPKHGVYKSIIKVDNIKYKAITNIGAHPTFQDGIMNIESFIFNFEGNLYGKTIEVVLLKYLREIKKFTSVKDLSIQIAKDIERVNEEEK